MYVANNTNLSTLQAINVSKNSLLISLKFRMNEFLKLTNNKGTQAATPPKIRAFLSRWDKSLS